MDTSRSRVYEREEELNGARLVFSIDKTWHWRGRDEDLPAAWDRQSSPFWVLNQNGRNRKRQRRRRRRRTRRLDMTW